MRTVEVNASALKQILLALTGPPYLIREIQATITLPDSPVQVLVDDYNRALEKEKG